MAEVTTSPKIPGLEPTFRHLDDSDVPWQQVRAVRRADGTVASVWEKWLAFSPEPLYLSLYAKWDPGVIQRRHGHFSPHVLMVLEGQILCGDRMCTPERTSSCRTAQPSGRSLPVPREPSSSRS